MRGKMDGQELTKEVETTDGGKPPASPLQAKRPTKADRRYPRLARGHRAFRVHRGREQTFRVGVDPLASRLRQG